METVNITELLDAHAKGDAKAFDRLMPLIYEELHRMAERRLMGERPDHTLSPTELVHEAYLKLIKFDRIHWQNSRHFFAIASRVMRNILVDYAVKQKSEKRGGKQQQVPLGNPEATGDIEISDILSIHHALQRLAKFDDRLVQVVECRFFGGLTIDETAQALGISSPTVNRDWCLARAWLNRELNESNTREGV